MIDCQLIIRIQLLLMSYFTILNLNTIFNISFLVLLFKIKVTNFLLLIINILLSTCSYHRFLFQIHLTFIFSNSQNLVVFLFILFIHLLILYFHQLDSKFVLLMLKFEIFTHFIFICFRTLKFLIHLKAFYQNLCNNPYY